MAASDHLLPGPDVPVHRHSHHRRHLHVRHREDHEQDADHPLSRPQRPRQHHRAGGQAVERHRGQLDPHGLGLQLARDPALRHRDLRPGLLGRRSRPRHHCR